MNITARAIVWEQDHAPPQWTDREYGFHITLEYDHDKAEGDDTDTPYFAAWGEGPEDSFATLEEAQAWCQQTIDRWVASIAVVEEAS